MKIVQNTIYLFHLVNISVGVHGNLEVHIYITGNNSSLLIKTIFNWQHAYQNAKENSNEFKFLISKQNLQLFQRLFTCNRLKE